MKDNPDVPEAISREATRWESVTGRRPKSECIENILRELKRIAATPDEDGLPSGYGDVDKIVRQFSRHGLWLLKRKLESWARSEDLDDEESFILAAVDLARIEC